MRNLLDRRRHRKTSLLFIDFLFYSHKKESSKEKSAFVHPECSPDYGRDRRSQAKFGPRLYQPWRAGKVSRILNAYDS